MPVISTAAKLLTPANRAVERGAAIQQAYRSGALKIAVHGQTEGGFVGGLFNGRTVRVTGGRNVRDESRYAARVSWQAIVLGGLATAALFVPLDPSQGQPRLASVEIVVTDVRDGTGHVRVALCTRETFPSKECPYHAAVPAQAGTTILRLGVPPGTYAAEAFHDDDDSGRMEVSVLGIPKKGIGFSGDTPLFGPPSFATAAVSVAENGARIVARLRYY